MVDIATGQIGPEAEYKVRFEKGKLIAQAKYDGAQFDADLMLTLDALAVVDALIDGLEEAIPGDQKTIAEMLKSAIKAVAA